MGQIQQKNNRSHLCGLNLWLLEYMLGAQKPHATGPEYLSVELIWIL